MENEILDDNLVQTNSNASIVNCISLIILWAGIAYCAVVGIIGNTKVIAAVVILVISTALTFYNYRMGAKITLVAIILGVFNLVQFSPFATLISFGIGKVGLEIELISLAIGVLHYFTNADALFVLFNRTITEKETESKERERVDGYKNKLSDKTLEELQVIVDNDNLVSQLRVAAKELVVNMEIK